MVVRVTVVDADQAAVLVHRVRREVDVVGVEFEQAPQQVRIEVEKNPDETLGTTLASMCSAPPNRKTRYRVLTTPRPTWRARLTTV